MIRKWLLKHRWVNESMKTIAAMAFALFGYSIWQGAELASHELASHDLATGSAAFIPLMVFGIAVGLMIALSGSLLLDVVYSIIGIIRKKRRDS